MKLRIEIGELYKSPRDTSSTVYLDLGGLEGDVGDIAEYVLDLQTEGGSSLFGRYSVMTDLSRLTKLQVELAKLFLKEVQTKRR